MPPVAKVTIGDITMGDITMHVQNVTSFFALIKASVHAIYTHVVVASGVTVHSC